MIRGWRAQQRRREVVRAVLLGAGIAIVLLPIVWTALAAIGIEPNNNTSPPSWVVVPLATALSFLAAYGIARSMGPALRHLSPGLLVLASLPVMAYVLPLSDLLRRLGLLDSLPGLTFAEAAVTAPLAVYVLSAHLAGTSRETEEAARLEGASLAKLLGSIVLPAAAPIVAATAIVLFVLDWNMLLIPLVLTGIDVRTLPVILTDFFTLEREVEWPTAAAALTISLVPLLILVGLFHRLLERFSLGGDASEPA